MYLYLGIAVLVIILIIWLLLKYKNKVDSFVDYPFENPIIKNRNSINKIIWTYWNDLSNVPHIVTKCIDTWFIHNNDYEVYILDDDRFEKLTNINITNEFQITNNKSHQKKSDFIRLTLIYMFGGIWMDASMICMESLNWLQTIQKNNNYEFIGYIAPDTLHDPVIDSWFLAAVPNSMFLYDWLNEFKYSLTYSDDFEYCKQKIAKYPVPNQLVKMLPYLTIHLCNWIIRYNNPKKYNLYIISSTDVGSPLYYMEKNKFYLDALLNDLKTNSIVPMKLFKIIGPLRNFLIKQKKQIKTTNKYINYVFDNAY